MKQRSFTPNTVNGSAAALTKNNNKGALTQLVSEDIDPFNRVLCYAHVSKAGTNGNIPKTNQDNFIIHQRFNGRSDRYFSYFIYKDKDKNNLNIKRHLFSVCDGHGIYGHLVSSFIRTTLPSKKKFNLNRINLYLLKKYFIINYPYN